MKRLQTVIVSVIMTFFCAAQTPAVKWGNEFNLRKGLNELEIVGSDATGIYLKEEYAVLGINYVFSVASFESASLIKMDMNLNQLYNINYKEELGKKDFKRFLFFKDRLFLFATEYIKKELTFKLFAVEINKTTGALEGEMIEIASITKENKDEVIYFRPDYNADSSAIVLVSTITGRERNSYDIRELNERMQPVGKPLVISTEFNDQNYLLENMIFTSQKTVVLVGRQFENEDRKNEIERNTPFKNYNIRIYDSNGKKVKNINTSIPGKWLTSIRIEQIADKDLVMAAFYNNKKQRLAVSGLLLQRINPVTGDILMSIDRELNTGMITDSESFKKVKQEEKTGSKKGINLLEDSFSIKMQFRKFMATPDNGLLIFAESYNDLRMSSNYFNYITNNVMIMKISETGKTEWLNLLPKSQYETISMGSNTGMNRSMSYFDNPESFPHYISFGVWTPDKNALYLIFNDHADNPNVVNIGQDFRLMNEEEKSVCYSIRLNLLTGKYSRQTLFGNANKNIPMPRLGRTVNNTFYMVGRTDRGLAKPKVAVAKISF